MRLCALDFVFIHDYVMMVCKILTLGCRIGSMVGFVLSSILLIGVLDSAVNTVLVCFAAGPFEFQTNHPRLSQEMRDAWGQQVWEPIV